MPSTAPYKFTFEGGEDNSYLFISHRDVVYQVKFKPSFYLFDVSPEIAEHIFELVIADIYVPRQQPPLLDLQTPVTIAAIVEDFLQKRERVAVYVLADSDGRPVGANLTTGSVISAVSTSSNTTRLLANPKVRATTLR